LRFAFRELPAGPGGTEVRARPLVDVVVGDLDLAPQACLLDSGATAIRMGAHVADLAGIDLVGALSTRLAVAGAEVEGRMAEVALEIGGDGERYRWTAPVWFCDPWLPGFGLLGLTGFFDQFLATVCADEEWFELRPLDS
jgi:hypothetical protein